MITLIIGKKGSGKTKKLIDAANNAIENTNGNVVVIEKESHLTLDISHQARLVALEPYGIHGCTAFYGFVSGICAPNNPFSFHNLISLSKSERYSVS